MTPEDQAGDAPAERTDTPPGSATGASAAPERAADRPSGGEEPRTSLDDSARREALQRSGAGAPSSSPIGPDPDRWAERAPATAAQPRPDAPPAGPATAATASTTGAGAARGPATTGVGASDSAATSVLPAPGGRSAGERARPSTRPGPPRPAARPASRPAARGRRARLVVQRVDAWSVFLFSLVASVCLGIVLLVAVATLYLVLSNLGVLSSVNTLLGEVLGSGDADEVVEPFFTPGRVLGATAVLAAVDVVLLTVLATLGALLYNLCASLTGGIEVVLGERE